MAKKSANKRNNSNNSVMNDSGNSKASLLSNEHFDETNCADYDEISTLKNDDDFIDHEKCEAFRRIASAEEIEEMSNEMDNDPERQAKDEEELRKELAKTEDEIQTLRTVLTAKIKRSNELKRALGITVWKEFRDEMETSIRNIQETTAYQKTSEAVKVGQQSVMGTLGSVARKLGEVKNTNAFKSFEEKVGYAVTNVKSKISSRSNSTTNFDEALKSSEQQNNSIATPVTTPSIPEDKPLK